MQGGETLTVGVQRALGASWLQTDDARDQAHRELRHLGLPPALADDLLAAAAYLLALDLEHRDHPLPSDDPLTPAGRALSTAARGLLRARRTGRPQPLGSASGHEDDGRPPPSTGGPLDEARLRADARATDRRRRAVSALAVDRPHERAAALTALTLATEPRIAPKVDAPPAHDPDVVGRLAWAGLSYAGRAGTAGSTHDMATPGRRAELALRQRQTDAIAHVEQLLADALAAEDRRTGEALFGPVPDATVGVPPPADPTASHPTNDLVHRRAAHG